jgi:hypothetical protein
MIDKQKLEDLIEQFNTHVIKHSANGIFSSFEGNDYLCREEEYKINISKTAKQILSNANITQSDIGSGKIQETIFKILNSCQNLVHYNQIISAKNKINEYPYQAERILYDIYYSNDEKLAFENAIQFFGAKYDLLAYLFFIKDCSRFLPIRAKEFDKRFELLGVDFKTSFKCSWGNYARYIGLIQDIRFLLEKSLGFPVRLIDAHSFVWMLKWIKDENLADDKVDVTVSFIAGEPVTKEKEQKIQARIGQGTYRKKLMELWGFSCSITNCTNKEFLVASHIKPWKECTMGNEWINPFNGLLLTPNLDVAFDKGYISFENGGKILISSQLTKDEQLVLGIHDNLCLKKVHAENQPFLEYHRLNIFKR